MKPDRRECNANEPEARSEKTIVFLARKKIGTRKDGRRRVARMGKKGRTRAIGIERREILQTSASRKMRYAKREKRDGGRDKEREIEREKTSVPTHGKKRDGKKGTTQEARGDSRSRMARTYARSRGRGRGARPRKRQTDGFTYL